MKLHEIKELEALLAGINNHDVPTIPVRVQDLWDLMVWLKERKVWEEKTLATVTEMLEALKRAVDSNERMRLILK